MKKIILTISTLLLITSFLYAADSAGNRGESNVMIGVAPIGIHVSTLIARPVRLAAFINPEIMVGVDSGSTTYTKSSGTAYASATYSNQGLNGRYFFGNSFNVSAGYHQRNWTTNATSSLGLASATVSLDAKASVLTLGVGNHWLMDWGFWIGGDWALLSGVLSKSSEATVTSTSGGGVSSAEKDVEELGNLLNNISALSGFAVLTIGFAF